MLALTIRRVDLDVTAVPWATVRPSAANKLFLTLRLFCICIYHNKHLVDGLTHWKKKIGLSIQQHWHSDSREGGTSRDESLI